MSRTILLLALATHPGDRRSLGAAAYLLLQNESDPLLAAAVAPKDRSHRINDRQPPTFSNPGTNNLLRPAATQPRRPGCRSRFKTEKKTARCKQKPIPWAICWPRPASSWVRKMLSRLHRKRPWSRICRCSILRAIPLTVQVDGQTLAIFSSPRTTAEVLAQCRHRAG